MTTQMGKVIQHLRSTLLLRDGADLTDGELLECFVSRRETAALEALVRRHGPMVWGVCLRILRNHHDAEDAFQATFLVLIRKAASVMPREMVGNWLYGVAQQTALKARTMTAKQRTRERQIVDMLEPAVQEQNLSRDWQLVLDQELNRLPDKYRVAIVLCDLEGETRKEAARQLGLPEGTLAGRLTRGRAMLAKRLARHGLAVTGGTLAAWLSQTVASASVPTSVLSSTIKVVTVVAVGKTAATGLVSAKVATLTEGVLKAMLISKLKAIIAVVLALGFITTGAAVCSWRTEAAQGDAPVVVADQAATLQKQGPEREKEAFTAWGKEIGGLQAGLGYPLGQKRTYRQGETVKIVLRVRNVGKEAVDFKYIAAFFIENPPKITNADGKMVQLPNYRTRDQGLHMARSSNVAAGKEIELYEWTFDLQPNGEDSSRSFIHGTGKHSLQCKRIVGPTWLNPGHPNPTLSKLATGTLILEIEPEKREKAPPKDLGKIQPPGGVPLFIGRKGEPIRVDGIEKARARLEAVPAEDLEKWVVELERIIDQKLKDGLPSARQLCRTDFAIRLSAAFDNLKWNAKTADDLYKRAQAMPATEAKIWKEAFESLLKKKIGQTDDTVHDGGPSWAVPLVLIPVDAFHDGQKYNGKRGKKYLARLRQLTVDDVSLWKDNVDEFEGTKLDAAVNIILLNDFFDKEKFQRDKFKAAVGKLKR